MSSVLIQDREFGELSERVKNLADNLKQVRDDVHVIDGKMDGIVSRFDRIDGGWKVLMFLAGISGTVGAALTFVAVKIWPFLLGTLPRI